MIWGLGTFAQWNGRIFLPGFEPRGALVTDMLIDGQPLRVVNAHLGLLPGSRAAQARALLDKLGSLEARPTLLMGDLNEWRGKSAALKTFGAQFTIGDPRPSFPSRYPLLARISAAISAITATVRVRSRRRSMPMPLWIL